MILEGTLENMGDGMHSMLTLTQRIYLKISGRRIKKSLTSSFIDGIMQENVGNEIKISTRKSILGTLITAIKEPNGEISKLEISVEVFLTFLRGILNIPILAVVCTITSILSINDEISFGVSTLIDLFFLFFFPILGLIRDLKSRNKLK